MFIVCDQITTINFLYFRNSKLQQKAPHSAMVRHTNRYNFEVATGKKIQEQKVGNLVVVVHISTQFLLLVLYVTPALYDSSYSE